MAQGVTICVDYSSPVTYPDGTKRKLHQNLRRGVWGYRLAEMRQWLHPTQEVGGLIRIDLLYDYIKRQGILATCVGWRELEAIRQLDLEVYRAHFGDKTLLAWRDAVEVEVVKGRCVDTWVPCLSVDEVNGQLAIEWVSFATEIHCDPDDVTLLYPE